MKKIFSIAIIVICLSTISVLAIYKITKEKSVTVEVDCVDAETFRGTAFEIMDNNKNNKCGIRVDDNGLEFVESDNNYVKYNNNIYRLRIVKDEYFVFELTSSDNKKIKLDYLMKIESGNGSKNNPYIISSNV